MADIKISDATPIDTLVATDMVPVARLGSYAPYNATMQEFARFITALASTEPPMMSSKVATAGVAEQYARADHQHPTDQSRAPVLSPAFKGLATSPTMPATDSSDAIATTKFVHDLAESGTLRTLTPGIDDNTELVATTEFVINQGSTQPPSMDGVSTAGVSLRFSRGDHTHPSDVTRYAASNPAGYVDTKAAAAAAPVQSVATRTGVITLTHSDITDWNATLAPYAPLASPPFSGSPTAPNQPITDASTKLATTFFVRAGTTTNDTPPTGQIGEYLAAQVVQSAAVPLAANAVINIAQITLTPGDWGVSGNVGLDCALATTLSCGINTTSAQLPIGGTSLNSLSVGGNVTLPHANLPIPATRFSVATPTTIYLVGNANAAGTVYGSMNARRVR